MKKADVPEGFVENFATHYKDVVGFGVGIYVMAVFTGHDIRLGISTIVGYAIAKLAPRFPARKVENNEAN